MVFCLIEFFAISLHFRMNDYEKPYIYSIQLLGLPRISNLSYLVFKTTETDVGPHYIKSDIYSDSLLDNPVPFRKYKNGDKIKFSTYDNPVSIIVVDNKNSYTHLIENISPKAKSFTFDYN